MRFWIAVICGIASGLVGSWLWRLCLVGIGHCFFPEALRTYDADLVVGRTKQREGLSPSRRTLWGPVLEEITVRALPVRLWLSSNVERMAAIPTWFVLNGIWTASHIWKSDSHWWNVHRQPQWTTSSSMYLHQIALLGYAFAYTIAWVVAGLGLPPKWPIGSLVIALIRGFLAATIAHSTHNYLILDKRSPGRCYRRLRGIGTD